MNRCAACPTSQGPVAEHPGVPVFRHGRAAAPAVRSELSGLPAIVQFLDMTSVQAQAETGSMKPLRFTDGFKTLYSTALRLADAAEANALLLLVSGPGDWARLKSMAGPRQVLVAGDTLEQLEGAADAGLQCVVIDMAGNPVYDRLTQALLEAVADDILHPGSCVVAMYSGFDAENIDSVSVIKLGEHLDRLSGRDLRLLETRVPLDTLKVVVDLATEIGREGREGKPVGTMFVVGDTRKVLSRSHPQGFDPVRGYSRKERNLHDPRVREGIKEIAQMDGAIIVSADGTVECACRYVDSSAEPITLSKGLGARHWAAVNRPPGMRTRWRLSPS